MSPEEARQKNPGQTARRVLMIKLGTLREFMLSLGAMKAIRAFHPRAQITLLTTPTFKEFAARCPYVDVVEDDGETDGPKAAKELAKRLSAANYDVVYDLETSDRTNSFFKMMKPRPLWSGTADNALFAYTNPARGSLHAIDRLGEQLHFAGLTTAGGGSYLDTPPMPDFGWISGALNHPPRLKPEYFGLNGPYMLLIPGSKEKSGKRWPDKEYIALAREIARAGVIPALIGGPAEADIAQALQKAVPEIRNLVTRTDFFQISTLAAHARFVVGNDTGPMHLATLSGAPGIALFASAESGVDHVQPRGAHVVVVHGETLEAVRAIGVPGETSGVFDMLVGMGLIDYPAQATASGATA